MNFSRLPYVIRMYRNTTRGIILISYMLSSYHLLKSRFIYEYIIPQNRQKSNPFGLISAFCTKGYFTQTSLFAEVTALWLLQDSATSKKYHILLSVTSVKRLSFVKLSFTYSLSATLPVARLTTVTTSARVMSLS